MPLVLARIDDRLLHGQVTHGWTDVLRPELILVIDDAAAADEWEREAYEASGPDGADVQVIAVDAAVDRFHAERFDPERTLVLVRGPETALSLVRRGVPLLYINVGGLHASPGRAEFESDLQLSLDDARAFAGLAMAGVTCTYQPTPDRPRRPLPTTAEVRAKLEAST